MASKGIQQDCDAIFGDIVLYADQAGVTDGKTNKRIDRILEALGTPIAGLETTSETKLQKKRFDSPSASPVLHVISYVRYITWKQSKRNKQTDEDLQRFGEIITELVTTERSFVRRIGVLKTNYHNALSGLCQVRPDLISLYEIKLLFNNIDTLYQANKRFLAELEQVVQGHKGHWADVVVRHLELFVPIYQKWYEGYRQSKDIEIEAMKKPEVAKVLARVRENTATSDIGNTGLRELIMEPVQRIPRYKLILEEAFKCMAPDDPNIPSVEDAVQIVSEIASCRTNEVTRRLATMFGMKGAIMDWPSEMSSNGRFFIDCVDVEDMPCHPNANGDYREDGSLNASLLLFNDCLVIVKQPKTIINAKTATGMNDLQALVDRTTEAAFAGPSVGRSPSKSSPQKIVKPMERRVLQYKGRVPLHAVHAIDLGHEGFAVYLGQQPSGYSANWSQRPLRRFHVRQTPESLTPYAEKLRFLQHLWNASAQYGVSALQIAGTKVTTLPTTYRSMRLSRPAYNHNNKTTSQPNKSVTTYFSVWTPEAYARLPDVAKRPLTIHLCLSQSSIPLRMTKTSPLAMIYQLGPIKTEWRLQTVEGGVIEDYGTLEQALVRCAGQAFDRKFYHVPPLLNNSYSNEYGHRRGLSDTSAPALFDTRLIDSVLSRNSTVRSDASKDTYLTYQSSPPHKLHSPHGSPEVHHDVFYDDRSSQMLGMGSVAKKFGKNPLSLLRKPSSNSSMTSIAGQAVLERKVHRRDPIAQLKNSVGHSASMGDIASTTEVGADNVKEDRGRAQSVPPPQLSQHFHPEVDQSNQSIEEILCGEDAEESASLPVDPFNGPRPFPTGSRIPIRSVSGHKRLREQEDNDAVSDHAEILNESVCSHLSSDFDGEHTRKRSRQDLHALSLEQDLQQSPAHQRVATIKAGVSRLKSHIDQVKEDRDAMLRKASQSSLRQPLRSFGSNNSLPRSGATHNIHDSAEKPRHNRLITDDLDMRLNGLYDFAARLQEECDRMQAEDTPVSQARAPDTEGIEKLRHQLSLALEQNRLLEVQLASVDADFNDALDAFETELRASYEASRQAHPQLSLALLDELRQCKQANFADQAEIRRLKRSIDIKDTQLSHYIRIYGPLQD